VDFDPVGRRVAGVADHDFEQGRLADLDFRRGQFFDAERGRLGPFEGFFAGAAGSVAARGGGVRLSCGEGPENWWVMVKDTGPGMLSGPGAPMGAGLKEATASARESDVKATAATGGTSDVLKPPSRAAVRNGPAQPQPGEGIGLSIVKRLCELLDASLEMASSAETGTTFRVVLPRRYEAAARRPETT